MFNCVVDVTEQLSYPSKDQKRRDFLKNKKARRNKKHCVQLEKEEETEGKCRETEAEAASLASSSVEIPTESNTPGDPSSAKTDNIVGDLGKDVFHPVMCKICNTKVAVYDSDEVYHFFNVVTSY